jgi:hypothetical protein
MHCPKRGLDSQIRHLERLFQRDRIGDLPIALLLLQLLCELLHHTRRLDEVVEALAKRYRCRVAASKPLWTPER